MCLYVCVGLKLILGVFLDPSPFYLEAGWLTEPRTTQFQLVAQVLIGLNNKNPKLDISVNAERSESHSQLLPHPKKGQAPVSSHLILLSLPSHITSCLCTDLQTSMVN